MTLNIGDIYGRLTVTAFHHSKVKYYPRQDRVFRNVRLSKRTYNYYVCKCTCGRTCVVEEGHLRTGHTVSCGCYRKDKLSRSIPRKHGLSKHPLYNVWVRMRARCYNKNYPTYKHYGGRGIGVCPEWRDSPVEFIKWAEKNHLDTNKGLSIDRIDNDGDYSPENCRVANLITQGNNKRNNHKVTYNGETHTVTEWSRITGISVNALLYRLNNPKWTLDKVFEVQTKDCWFGKSPEFYESNEVINDSYECKFNELPKKHVVKKQYYQKDSLITYHGETNTISNWASIVGLKPHVLLRRFRLGWDTYSALYAPAQNRKKGNN